MGYFVHREGEPGGLKTFPFDAQIWFGNDLPADCAFNEVSRYAQENVFLPFWFFDWCKKYLAVLRAYQPKFDAARQRAMRAPGLKTKDLMGVPWTLALILRTWGWYLRSEVIWAKPNPMPERRSRRPRGSSRTFGGFRDPASRLQTWRSRIGGVKKNETPHAEACGA